MNPVEKAEQEFEEALEAAEGVLRPEELARMMVKHIDDMSPERRETVLSREATRALYDAHKPDDGR